MSILNGYFVQLVAERFAVKKPKAFTLIELLIVVAIIAILAAIAVPNFLEAQTRSKVSRTLADMRSVATALEAYRVDYTRYPKFSRLPQSFTLPAGPVSGLSADTCLPSSTGGGLTSPIAYMTSIPGDPFGEVLPDDQFTFGGSATIADTYYYNTKEWYECRNFPWLVSESDRDPGEKEWVLQSKGPDKYFAPNVPGGVDHVDRPYRWQYDPTNGTVSGGNVIRSGP